MLAKARIRPAAASFLGSNIDTLLKEKGRPLRAEGPFMAGRPRFIDDIADHLNTLNEGLQGK